MTRHLVVIGLSFVIGVGAALLMRLPTVQEAFYGTLNSDRTRSTGKALIGGAFAMVDQTGKVVTEADFSGRYKLLFFGFTNCPDFCPASLQVASEAMAKLGADGDKITPIFVSVDPARDTPAVLKDYLSNFDPRMVGLTGTEAQVRAMTKAYRVFAKAQPADADGNYSVDHSTIMYLMGPDDTYVTHFPYGMHADEMARKLREFTK